MEHDDRDILEVLKFELKFLEDGGYGRSPRTPWRPPYIFEDSPSCPNFCDPSRPTPCEECRLMHFVPDNMRDQQVPCRFIPINKDGHTIEDFYRTGTQVEMEEALAGWLRTQIARIEQERARAGTEAARQAV
jgi:hypothetical protein